MEAATPQQGGNRYQLNSADALRFAESDRAFAQVFLTRPREFAELFSLRESEIALISEASRSNTVENALKIAQAELERATLSAPDETVRLDVNDLLRLAADDEIFAAAVLSSPEGFKHGFNLTDTEIESIGRALDTDTIEDAIAKLRTELADGPLCDEQRSTGLNVNDVIRLAAANERFASAVLRSPTKFQQPFNLTDSDMLEIANALDTGRAARSVTR